MSESQESGKRRDDAIANEITQALKDWDDRFERCGASIPEGYLKGHLGLIIRGLIRVNAGDLDELNRYSIDLQYYRVGDKFQPPIEIELLSEPVDGVVGAGTETEAASAFSCGGSSANRKVSMLVDAVEIVNLPERMRCIAIPSVIRLHCSNINASSAAHAADLPDLSFGVESVGFEDGKLRFPHLLVSDVRSVGFCQSKGQVVEGCAEIEKAVAKNKHQSVGCGIDTNNTEPSITDAYLHRLLLGGIRVWFINHSIGISFDPECGFIFESIQVLSCSAKLEGKAI